MALTVTRLSFSAFQAMASAFDDLSARSPEANPHLSPAAIAAATTLINPDDIVILAASQAEGPLMGLWAFSLYRGAETGGVTVLRTPLVPLYDVLAAPVLDRDCAPAALEAILAFIAANPGLPKVIMAHSLPLEGPTHAVFSACMSVPGRRLEQLESWPRGVTLPRTGETPEAAMKRALGTSAKKRQTQRRALERLGNLRFQEETGVAAIAGFERFLTLEDRGWKGKDGTSILKSGADAVWWRALVANLAAVDAVTIASLMLDGAPVASGAILVQDGVHLFMKTAFDENFAKFSPGLHLEIEITRAALVRGDLVRFDCGGSDGVDPAAHIWAERRQMAHAMIVLDGSAFSRLPVLASRTKAGLRQLRNRLRG
jgi:CelD/BcsL family acetyltransferase involved in cellulose biosynthesis